MVAVVPNLDTANAWQPPASGIIKDGFMRADGATVPSGQGSPLQGKVLPNMTPSVGNDRYLKASRATSWTTGSYTTSGVNTYSLAANQLPTFTTDAHGHTWGGHWSIDNATSVSGGNGDGSQNTYSDGIVGIYAWGAGSYAERATGSHVHHLSDSTVQAWAFDFGGGDDLYAAVKGTDASTDNWGNTSGATSQYYLPSHRHWIMSRGTTTSAVTRTNASQQSINNEPAYLEVVYVIRVK
jgi:hypothetical protein